MNKAQLLFCTELICFAAGMSGAIESALRALVEAGVEEVAVTELDIVNGTPQDWRDVVKACYYVPKCVGVTTWGIRDADSWQPGKNSLMFNNDYAPTDSYYATRDYLRSIQK
jgi:endo-1,4-beta-xylanase